MEHLKELNMKLISSIEFGKTLVNETDSEYRRKRDLFDNFIEQPLTLGMFVPCDEEGNVLNEQICDFNKYQQAKERVLFVGFSVEFNAIISPQGGYLDTSRLKHRDIESLICTDINLTNSAQKQIM